VSECRFEAEPDGGGELVRGVAWGHGRDEGEDVCELEEELGWRRFRIL